MKTVSTCLEVVGFGAITAGICLISWHVGLIVAGSILFMVGVVREWA